MPDVRIFRASPIWRLRGSGYAVTISNLKSNLAKDHEKYMPLHRDRSFRNDERVLVKYLIIMTWFTDEKLQDPFRQEWKKLIRYKDSGQPKPRKQRQSKNKSK